MTGKIETGKPKTISTAELERRRKAAREAMKDAGLDFLLIENSASFFPGHIRWFTELPVHDGDPVTLIFPRNDDMTVMSHGDTSAPLSSSLPGIKKYYHFPQLHALKNTDYLQAEKVVEELKPYKNCRIGVVGPGFMSAAFYQYVTSHLDSAKFTDVTDMVDSLKVIKSDEEIDFIREACRLQDTLFEYALTCIKPGRRTIDVANDLRHRSRQSGSGNDMTMVNSVPQGKTMNSANNNGIIGETDQCIILFENESPAGYWTEMVRIICPGKVSAELEEQFSLAQQAQKMSLEMLKPGVSPADLYHANNRFLRSHGYPEQNALYGHGQGYDIAERPGLDAYEKFSIQGRMNIAVHPMFISKQAIGWVCENYLVSENGEPERLHQTPQKIFHL